MVVDRARWLYLGIIYREGGERGSATELPPLPPSCVQTRGGDLRGGGGNERCGRITNNIEFANDAWKKVEGETEKRDLHVLLLYL